MNNRGFMLVEAVAAVALVSVCLVLIIQALLTNTKAGTRFQQKSRALFAAENRLGLIFASAGQDDALASSPAAAPYDRLSVRTDVQEMDDHLRSVRLAVTDAAGKPELNVTTFIFRPEQAKSSSVLSQ